MDETFGRYRLLERLGHGGMAEVFKAKSFGVEGFEKVLVIKRILPELAKSKKFSDLFVHEAKLAVRLSHANIVQVFDLGTVEQSTGATYFIAMEYVAGLDLATLLAHVRKSQLQLPVGMCVYIAAEVAKGLDHAHRRRDEQLRPLGIVHRDVSPHNILLSWEGEVKVTDFGIAKARDLVDDEPAPSTSEPDAPSNDEQAPHLLHGKYAYMSPEQARGHNVDARSDIFSLGVVLYEMLTGVNPFRAPTMMETLRRVKASEYPPAELLRPELPSALASLLRKALAEAPEQRFADAGRLYESLLAHLYSSGDRCSANDVAQYIAKLRANGSARAPSLRPDAMASDRPTGATETTPVEVPSPSNRAPSIPPETPDGVAALRNPVAAERREVTALVLRLGASSDEVTHDMRRSVRELVERHGGIVVEDEPPQLAALFGLSDGDGRDIETAARVALIALRRTGAARAPRESLERGVSAGIHAGRILISHTGEPLRNERLTSLLRMAQEMSGVSPRACGISTSAAQSVRRSFRCSAPEGQRPIGATSGLVLTELASPADALGRFVGRKAELKRVGEVLSLANRGRVFALTVRGQPGIGKTRLLLEIDRRLKKGEFKVAFYLSSCPPNGHKSALSGLSGMLQVLCGIREGDSEPRILEVEPRLRALGLNEEEVIAVLFHVGASKRSGASRNALRTAFARMVASLAKDQLHVFAWDNAQALDHPSVEILEYAAHRNADVRSVFVVAVREGCAPPLSGLRHTQLIELGELGDHDLNEFVSARTGLLAPPSDLVAFCRERAAGHPLFAEELLRELLDDGALVVENGAVVEWKPPTEVAVPRTLRALVAARAARLAEDERRALQAAAILSDPVDLATLAHMLGEPLTVLERLAKLLDARDFLRRVDASTVAFASPLLREVVIDALPAEACRAWHTAAAEAYEHVFGDRAIEQSERIARHYYEAGERDRAAVHFARSGQRKLAGRLFEGALRDMLRALELCDLSGHRATELASWISDLASAAYRVRSAPELLERSSALLERIDADGDRSLRVSARIDLASILVSTHALEAADRFIADAKMLANGNARLLAHALLTEAELARRAGNWRKALARFEELASLPLDDDGQSHRVCMGLALCYAASGSEARAEEVVAIAARISASDDIVLACERAKLEQLIAIFSRDYGRAIEKGNEAVALARQAGLAYEVAVNLHIVGEALFRNHELASAYASFQQSSALCEEIAAERVLVHNRSFLAYLDAPNDYASAARALGESIAYARAHHYAWDEVNARYLLARLLRDQAQPEARAEFERCRELAQSVGFRLLADDCLAALTS